MGACIPIGQLRQAQVGFDSWLLVLLPRATGMVDLLTGYNTVDAAAATAATAVTAAWTCLLSAAPTPGVQDHRCHPQRL